MIIRSNKKAQNSFLAAMYICEVLIANVLSIFVKLSHYPLYVLALITMGVIFVNRHFDIGKIKKSALLYAIILFLFGISAMLNGFTNVKEYFQYFVSFGFVALLVSSFDIDYNKVLIYIIYIYLWFLAHYFVFIRHDFLRDRLSDTYQARSIGLAYSLTIIVYIFLAYLFFRKEIKFSKWQRSACLLCSILTTYILLFDCGTRGPIFSCAIGFFLAYLANTEKKYSNLKFLLVSTCLLYVFSNMESTVQSLINLLSSYGIIPGFLKKISFFIKKGDILNGRGVLYAVALNFIGNSPITGNGIGYFEARVGGYVHNIFLELLCTFGIIGCFFFLFYIFSNIAYFVSKKRTEETVFIFVVTSAFSTLIFSNSFWLSPQFWYMFFLFYNRTSILKLLQKTAKNGAK